MTCPRIRVRGLCCFESESPPEVFYFYRDLKWSYATRCDLLFCMAICGISDMESEHLKATSICQIPLALHPGI
ncbi:hypothetical protein KP509_24G022400 [Ceratopteris richardii]|uniref:Uncharacterized protein n=1 Tax=Ceratopteris richardii TaxID=49495 RepID=A0A8T2RTU9_CERRI|nr:hypothetical protein KP509_24G022400 [Ceratopteris richardii]